MGIKDRFLDALGSGEPRELQVRYAELLVMSNEARNRWADAEGKLVKGAFGSDEEREALQVERRQAHEEMLRALQEANAVQEEMKRRGISVEKAQALYDERLEAEEPIAEGAEPAQKPRGRTS